MKDEAIFFVLKFSKQDWVKFYSIAESDVDEFLEWLWIKIGESNEELSADWVISKIKYYQENSI